MQSPDIETIVKTLLNRRDSISVAAARLIRNLQSEHQTSYMMGWDAALEAAIKEAKRV